MQLDIDAIQHIVDINTDSVNSVEDRFEKLELKSKKSSMRVFGLNEVPNEHAEGLLKKNVIDNVLKIACPLKNWPENCISDAFRIGEASQDQPKITIVKFEEFKDKVEIFKSRDILRESGIRISDDLTDKQRLKLVELKKKGQVGYYQKGELKIRENTEHPNKNYPRTFTNVKRRRFNFTSENGTTSQNASSSFENEGGFDV